MLFSRRKAEIEVLSAARPAANAIADLDPGVRVAGTRNDHLREGSSSGIPLVRYLLAKIRSACSEAGLGV